MPKIETQGVSEDYSTATGIFESIERGEVSKGELLEILRKISVLQQPFGDNDCPPTVNAMLSEGFYTCFAASNGRIDCVDSKTETMSASDAANIICGDQSIAEYDALHGFESKQSSHKTFIAVTSFLIIGAILFYFIK